jgi:hypothetical protein
MGRRRFLGMSAGTVGAIYVNSATADEWKSTSLTAPTSSITAGRKAVAARLLDFNKDSLARRKREMIESVAVGK